MDHLTTVQIQGVCSVIHDFLFVSIVVDHLTTVQIQDVCSVIPDFLLVSIIVDYLTTVQIQGVCSVIPDFLFCQYHSGPSHYTSNTGCVLSNT